MKENTMSEEQNDAVTNAEKKKSQAKPKTSLLSWKNVKTGLKYTAYGIGIAAGLFLLTKPPLLLAILRIGVPLALIGGAAYGVSLIVRPRKGNQSAEKPEQDQKKKTGGFTRRIIRRKKPGPEFNETTKTKTEVKNTATPANTAKPKKNEM